MFPALHCPAGLGRPSSLGRKISFLRISPPSREFFTSPGPIEGNDSQRSDPILEIPLVFIMALPQGTNWLLPFIGHLPSHTHPAPGHSARPSKINSVLLGPFMLVSILQSLRSHSQHRGKVLTSPPHGINDAALEGTPQTLSSVGGELPPGALGQAPSSVLRKLLLWMNLGPEAPPSHSQEMPSGCWKMHYPRCFLA